MFPATLTRSNNGHVRRVLIVALATLLLFAALAIVPGPSGTHGARAASGDFSLDFIASEPSSYDHATGGGNYGSRTIGVEVVESLEGGDFACNDIVTYLIAVAVDDTQSADDDAPQTIAMDFSFLADTTGQSGVAIGSFGPVIDYNTGDPGNSDDGGSTVTLVNPHLTGPIFQSGSELVGTVTVDDLERNEQVIIRIDVVLECDPGSRPTGNLQGALEAISLTHVAGEPITPEAVSGGNQTIPFKQIGNISSPGSLTIVKNTTGGNGAFEFTSVMLGNFTLDTGTGNTASTAFIGLVPDVYDVAESVPAGWELTDSSCSNGDDPSAVTLGDGDDVTCTFENFKPMPSIAIDKTGSETSISVPTTIDYDFVITNTGNVALNGVTLADDMLTNEACQWGSSSDGSTGINVLSPGETVPCTGSYDADQADINAGTDLVNIATADSDETGPVTDTWTVTITQDPSIAIDKTGSETSISVPTTIDYDFVITNTGNVALNGVTLADDMLTNEACQWGSSSDGSTGINVLSPGETVPCTGSYDADQADINAGTDLVNIATADSDETGPVTDTWTVTITQDPSIAIDKTGSETSISVPTTIDYDFVITNTGNVALNGVTLADDMLTNEACQWGSSSDGSTGINVLSPGETVPCTGSYDADQADINAGTDLVNIATADSDETGPVTDTWTVTITQDPSIAIDKTGSETSISVPTTIDYDFVITNTGNVALNGVTLADDMLTNEACQWGSSSDGSTGINVLSPGETVPCTGSYDADQADINAGTDLVNIATADSDETGPVTDTWTVTITQDPSIAIDKTGSETSISVPTTIDYDFVITNTGNVALNGVTLADDMLTNEACQWGSSSDGSTGINVLSPGETVPCTGSYDADQADINAGTDLVNIATADSDETGPVTDTWTVTITQDPSIVLAKSGTFTDESGDGFAQAGETISYTFIVTNTGNVSLVDVTLDDLVGGVTVTGGPIALLPVGAFDDSTFTGSYTLTQADVDSGTFYNVAEACGIDPSESEVCDDDDHEEPLPQDPSIVLAKSGTFTDESGDGFAQAGETISYTFIVANDGNVSLVDVTLDDLVGGVTVTGGPIALLPVGAFDDSTFTGSYTLTQADVDSGTFYNVAEACGIDPSESEVCDDDDHEEPLPQDPSIVLAKSGTFTDESGDGFAQAGETISYTFIVANDGNVSLVDVTLDDLVGGVTVTGGPIALLPVGAFDDSTFTGSYTLTQADVDSGTFYNVAEACGIDPSESEVCDDDDHEEPLPQNPSIGITKDGAPSPIPVNSAGDLSSPVTWTIVVANTGNVTLRDVTLTDVLAPACDVAIGNLAVGGTAEKTCVSSLTPDSPAWFFTNVAVATGFGPLGTEVTAQDDATILPIFVSGTAQGGDTVFLDKDKDGVQDADEPGINGAKVILKDADGNVIATQTTFKGAWDGFYKFLELDAGTYTFVLDTTSVSGELTTAGSFTVTLADGEDYLLADFGVAEVLPVTGFDSGELALLAIAMLMLGTLAVLGARKWGFEEE